MGSSVAFLFLSLLLGSADSLPPPQISFLLNSSDRPLIHFQPDVSNTTTLLLSNDSSTLYVGARDAILSLDVSQSDVISLKKKVMWSPSEQDRANCASKGKNPAVDCPNFVHVVQALNSTHLYACGSYAYSPHQVVIDIERLSVVHQDGAKGRCPYNPFERSSVVIIDEELFSATTTDFKGHEPQISRFLTKDGRPDVSLDSIKLLDEPTFVSSSLDPAGQKLYFFFTEGGKEFSFVNELQIPRVAQVCKDDVGGLRILQKKWTSFAKAPLLCMSSKELPFNILEDMFTLRPPEGANNPETLFYGIFTSQWSRQAESAVCTFRLQDIQNVFAGSFKTLEKERYQQKHSQGRNYLGKCGLSNSSDSELLRVKTNYLTSQSVTPGKQIVSLEQKYSRLVVMRTQAANGKHYDILFLLTESGLLHKVVSLDEGPRVIEEIQVFKQPQLVKSMILSTSKGVLYVGSSEGVTAVPVARCLIYRSCSQCILARDPLCGWSPTGRTCTGLDGSNEDLVQHLEGSSIWYKCQQILKDNEVFVHLNEDVRLQCLKPSKLATLRWSFSPTVNLTENRFIKASDVSLRFFASTRTLGSYSCEAEEGGVSEEVVRYRVQLAASPRRLSTVNEQSVSKSPEELFEDIGTEEPTNTLIKNEERSQPIRNPKEDPEQHVTTAKGGTFSRKTQSIQDVSRFVEVFPTSRKDSKSMLKPSEEALEQRSYHSELVVVSLLLAICILVLAFGLFRIWQKKAGFGSNRLLALEDGSKTNTSEQICALSTLVQAGQDQTIIQQQ
ncbi:semaphorin-4B-like [Girardinichthys multiradiatus]|uniref:semaphorin-4B-like n=1 Tax=Girardinichthys multiradiatus TaxID=208333 RepID=UPI001FACA324|nr:semaphorin-4B-like [Girardinichthys multiradiatus]